MSDMEARSEFQGIFVGMIKNINIFLMANVVTRENEKSFIVKGVARVFEISGEGKIGYQFHPDPYFTNESCSHLDTSEFTVWRIEKNSDEKMVKDYFNFIQVLRMQKSGLIAGALNPEKAKQLVKDLK